MKRLSRPTPLALLVAAALAVLTIVPRLIVLGDKPLMHDESLFAYYAYLTLDGHYTHMPILHGPVLMLVAGKLFKIFGDSIAVGRAFVAVTTFFGLAAATMLLPRRNRWWLAPLLISSPVMLYYSRFFRDDMFFNAVLMVGMLGLVHRIKRRPGSALAGLVGPACIVFLLAIMENALFPYASAVTFVLVWLLLRRFRSERWSALRPWPRKPLREYKPPAPAKASPRSRRRRRGEAYLNNSFATIVGDNPPPEDASPVAPTSGASAASPFVPFFASLRLPRPLRWLLENLDWIAGLIIGVTLVLIAYGITSDPHQFHPLLNMKASWDYWSAQHKEHRIQGPVHYYLPILVTYELPILLAIGVGLAWDAMQRRMRAALYGGTAALWCVLWGLWRLPVYAHPFSPSSVPNPRDWTHPLNTAVPPHWMKGAMDFLHVEPNSSMLVLGLLIVPLLVWAMLSLKEHRPLAAWMGWWAACSLFQYSSAGEKVPWLAVHIMMPLYLTLGWLWAPRLRRFGPRAKALALAWVLLAFIIAARNDVHLIGDRMASPRERLIYNHTTPDFDRLCKTTLANWQRKSDRIPLAKRKVVMIDDAILGGPSWPGFWYFRHCNYIFLSGPQDRIQPGADLEFGAKTVMEPLLKKIDPDVWYAHQLPLRDAWIETWPDKDPWSAWWRYYWLRETWNPTGTFDLIALEPITPKKPAAP